MCEQNKQHSPAKQKQIQDILKHRGLFTLFSASATIALEKFLYEALSKTQHLGRVDIIPHTIADIFGCYLGEKITSSKRLGLSINITSHGIYEILSHNHEYHDKHQGHYLISLMILGKVAIEQGFHQWQHGNKHQSITSTSN